MTPRDILGTPPAWLFVGAVFAVDRMLCWVERRARW